MATHTEHAGMCVYCAKPANDTCRFCGGLVCKLHLHKSAGICTRCVGGRRVK
ncbi:MAG: hypothetical protein V1839_02020 [archaeon]